MKQRFLRAIVWGFGAAGICVALGALFSVIVCAADSGTSYVAGLCVMPVVWGGIAAVPIGLIGFVMGYAKATRGHSKKISALDLATNPQAFSEWQKRDDRPES